MVETNGLGPIYASANIESMSPRAIPRSQSRRYARIVRDTLQNLKFAIGAEDYEAAVVIFGQASPDVRSSLRTLLDETFRRTERLFDSGLTEIKHTLDMYKFATQLTRIDPDLGWDQTRVNHLTDAERAIVRKVGYGNLTAWYQEKPLGEDPKYPDKCLDDMLTTLQRKVPKGTEFQTRVRLLGQEKEYDTIPSEVAQVDLHRSDYIDVTVSHPRASGSVHIDVVNVARELVEGLSWEEANTVQKYFPTGEFYQVQIDGINPQWVQRRFAPERERKVLVQV